MNDVKTIAKNTLVLMAAQVIGMVIGLLYVMYTARYLGAESFGILSFAMALTGIFSVFTDMGFNTLAIREIAREKAQAPKYLGNILVIKIVLSIVTLGLITLVILIGGYPQDTIITIYLLTLAMIITAFAGTFNSVFQAFEKMEYQSISGILSNFLLIVGALAIGYYGYGVIAFAGLYLIINFLVLIYSFIVCCKEFTAPKIHIDTVFWSRLFKEALPFAITSISINVYLWINTIILSYLNGNESVGWYNAAYKLIIALLFIPIVFNTSIFPNMSRHFITSKDNLQLSFEKLLKVTLYIGFPLGIGIIAVAAKIIELLYGSQFVNSIIILQILSLSLILIFCRSPFERLLEASNKQAVVTKIFMIGAIFSVIANLVLIEFLSYIGAGVATVLTDSLVFIALMIVTKSIDIHVDEKEVLNISKMLLASILMGGIILVISSLNVFLIITISICVYIIFTLLFGAITKDEIYSLKNIFRDGDKNELSNM